MLRFATCCVVLCVVACCNAQQERCCIEPDMFVMTSGSLVGWHVDQYFGTTSQSVFSVIDFTQSRFLYNTTMYVEGNVTFLLMIDDYKQNTEWTIDVVQKKCQKKPLPEGKKKPDKCVPDNAMFIQQVTNPGDVLANSWYYEYKTPIENGKISLSVTDKDCIPTGTTFVGTTSASGQEVDILSAVGYYNYEPLSDVSKYFKLPSYCDSNQVIDTKVTNAARQYVKRYFL